MAFYPANQMWLGMEFYVGGMKGTKFQAWE